ncbi:MAG: hypothetical protein LUD00_10040 [Prevotellaceae bacterium]|nr:hypothetical protein [Prevotellaceae bacterium]
MFAVNYSDSNDYTYVSYVFSFFTWLGGAYAVSQAIKALHGEVTLRLVILYLTLTCVSQCVLAILIDNIPAFRQFVDSYIAQGQVYLQDMRRLYGIGASLDPAGTRFSVVLFLMAYLLCKDEQILRDKKWFVAMIAAYFTISVLGNMIARTTSVGMILGLVYIVYSVGLVPHKKSNLFPVVLSCTVVFVALVTFFYQTNPVFHKNLRFAFEGFFNWVETGTFRTDSTDKLNNVMWIWPEDLKGWIIGNGLFGNWIYSTDIGYCRFILYCGLVGFSSFCMLFIYNAWVFAHKFRDFGLAAFFLLVLSFVIWMKVATDLFFIYALFYCVDWDRETTFTDEMQEEEVERELDTLA